MKLSKTVWLILGIGVFVAATAVLYFIYQGRADERQQAKDTLEALEGTQLPGLVEDKQALEDQLAQIEAEIEQWQADISQLEGMLIEAELGISLSQQGFPASIDSIDYGEALFAFAEAAGIDIIGLDSSEPISAQVEGNVYLTTIFNLRVEGDTEEILDFINMIVNDEAFSTAVMEPVSLTIPPVITDEQIEDMEEALRKKLKTDALEEITTQQILDFILEAIEEVTGIEIETRLAEEMAVTIKDRIEGSLEGDYDDILGGELSEFIVEYITNSLVGGIIQPLAEEIAELVNPQDEDDYNEDALIELLGEDIAELLGEQIAGAMPGEIAGILSEFIAELVEAKMDNMVSGTVETAVNELVAQMLEEAQMSSADLELVIYAYQGEGE